MVCLGNDRDHSVVFEIASKYCISDSFVDHDGHSISSEGFVPCEDFRQDKQNKQHSWLSPICIGQAQVEEKTYKRRSQSVFSRIVLSLEAKCDL